MEASSSARVVVSASLGIAERSYFSIAHIKAAARFARLSAALERAYDGNYTGEKPSEHQGYVMGAVVFSACFLEATVNEVFADADHNVRRLVEQLDPMIVSRLRSMWRLGVPRTAGYSIMEKFQVALALAGKPELEKGQRPYQDADLVVKLRNLLVHYEPEWITTAAHQVSGAVVEHRMEKLLKGKFPISPFSGAGNAFFPKKCLGHGCARWAVESSIAFADAFFKRFGVKPTYEHVRCQLETE